MDSKNQIDYLLKSTWQDINNMYAIRAKKMETNISTAFALLTIHPLHGIASTDIGNRIGIANTSVSRIVSNLIQNNYIYKEDNPLDRRSVILKLTPAGFEKRELAKKEILDFNNFLNSNIDKKEFQIFKKVINNISKLTKEYKNKHGQKKHK